MRDGGDRAVIFADEVGAVIVELGGGLAGRTDPRQAQQAVVIGDVGAVPVGEQIVGIIAVGGGPADVTLPRASRRGRDNRNRPRSRRDG